MRYNKFVGMRYVPVFAGEWDKTRAYEQLTVVQYNGNSYTSIKSVPVGKLISDTEYWLQSGNYNAQVEMYRKELFALTKRVEELESKVNI
jgi:hypothetical protein